MPPPFVGRPLRRIEDPRLVRGLGQFVEDLRLPGTLHVAFVRSQYPHARFTVDAAAALALAGVAAVVTAKDLAELAGFKPIPAVVPHEALRPCGQHPLANGVARYVGEIVAAVVASSPAVAADGASAVEVEYEPLPPVPHARAATAEGAPRLHEDLADNLAGEFTVRVGDADAAFAGAEVVFREQYDVQRYTGLPMENRGVLARFDRGTGHLTLWSSTQWPHTVRDVLRDMLEIPEHKIRVIAPDVGGGFGVKQDIYPEEILLALLAMQLDLPVRWIETRREHLLTGVHAREQSHVVEIAARRDGTILGLRAEVLCDQGAYTRSLGLLCPSLTAAGLPGPYRIRDYTCHVRVALTNKAPASAYRGAGQPEAVFALERAMDHLAQDLGLDPAEVRLRNFIGPDEFPWDVGTSSAQVPVIYDSGRYAEGLQGALDLARYHERRAEQAAERARGADGRLIGIGMACYVMLSGLGPHEGAQLRIDASGKARLVTGSMPHGQGTATAIAQIVADQLGIPPQDVTVEHGDTDAIPFGMGTYASRNAVMAGNAAHLAARKVRAKVLAMGAQLLEADVQDLELTEGTVQVRGVPGRSVSLRQVAAAFAPGNPMPEGLEPSLEATHYFIAPRATFASGAHVAVVEVDRDSGRLEILGYVALSDAGPLLNPLIADGQIHGGVAQGLGGALYESLVYDGDGQLLTQSLLDYTMPRSTQVPFVNVAHLHTPSPLNPLGVKGLGEGGTMAPPPALAAAVEDALAPSGGRVCRTPLTPEFVRDLLARRANTGSSMDRGASTPPLAPRAVRRTV